MKKHGDPDADGRSKRKDRIGRHKTRDGYVRITPVAMQPGDEALGLRTDGTILEHRLVMARRLGRPLYPDETVHHRNGLRADNRPKNLELRASMHGSGQAVEDLVTYAKEILARYG